MFNTTRRAPGGLRTRLMLDQLEDRTNPAGLDWYWVGSGIGSEGQSWSNPANWIDAPATTNGVPEDGDSVHFGQHSFGGDTHSIQDIEDLDLVGIYQGVFTSTIYVIASMSVNTATVNGDLDVASNAGVQIQIGTQLLMGGAGAELWTYGQHPFDGGRVTIGPGAVWNSWQGDTVTSYVSVFGTLNVGDPDGLVPTGGDFTVLNNLFICDVGGVTNITNATFRHIGGVNVFWIHGGTVNLTGATIDTTAILDISTGYLNSYGSNTIIGSVSNGGGGVRVLAGAPSPMSGLPEPGHLTVTENYNQLIGVTTVSAGGLLAVGGGYSNGSGQLEVYVGGGGMTRDGMASVGGPPVQVAGMATLGGTLNVRSGGPGGLARGRYDIIIAGGFSGYFNDIYVQTNRPWGNYILSPVFGIQVF